jgi:hypothetical protein
LAEIGENDRVEYFGEPVGFDPYIGPCPLVVKDAFKRSSWEGPLWLYVAKVKW